MTDIVDCGAVPGASILLTAVPLTVASTTAATTAASLTVFGWCAVLGGPCNPFPLFFSLFPHSLFWNFFRQTIVQVYWFRGSITWGLGVDK